MRARSWMLDAVIDINFHPHLADDNRNVKDLFDSCNSFMVSTFNTMRGFGLIPLSLRRTAPACAARILACGRHFAWITRDYFA